MTKDMFKRHFKLVMLLLLVFLLLFGISACGKKEKKKDTEKKENKTEAVEDTNALPDEKRVLEDIQNGESIVYLPSVNYELETKSVKIDKAKKEEDQYFVYCTAEQESDMFNANNKYVMTYTFYDVGGWILEDCYMDVIDMIPKKCIPEEEVKTYILNTHGAMTLQRTEEKKVSDTEYTYHYKGTITHNYMDEKYDIEVNCVYDNYTGWKTYTNVTSYVRDWSKMCGVWHGETDKRTVTIKVHEVNENTGMIKCSARVVYKSSSKEVGFTDYVEEIELDEAPLETGRRQEGIKYVSFLSYRCQYVKDLTYMVILYWGEDIGLIRAYDDLAPVDLKKIE